MDLEVRHLKLVRAVAALGGLTRAGRELHLTQSALSHQLRDVESRLGTALFLRVGKRMVLTAAGERLRRSADEILGTLERTEDAIRSLAGGTRGRLRVSTGSYTEYHWLPTVMKRFREACPLVDLQIVPGAGHDATQLVLDGRVDVAIVSHDGGDARLTSQALFDDDVVVIVSSAHPFATPPRRCVEPHDFADQTLLLDMPHDRHAIYRRVVAADGIQPAAIQVVPQTGAMVELVKAGLGVGLIARWAVAPLVRSGDLRALPLTRTGVRHRWHGVYLNDLAEVAYVREFLVIATRGFLPLPRQGSDQR